MNNRGKQFEQKFALDMKKSFPDGLLIRLPDQQSGYKMSSQNLCDFLFSRYPILYCIEVKSHKGNTFPFTCLPQYDKLTSKVGIKGVRAGVVLWFIDHDQVIYAPISTITKMKEDGKKSINVKELDDYHLIKLPGQKKRVFVECDYRVLKDLDEGD